MSTGREASANHPGAESADEGSLRRGLVREQPEPGIEVLRLNRPGQLNAMSSALLDELVAALDSLAADDELRAVVFSTTSTAALSAGADVAEVLDADAAVARMEAFARLYAGVEACPVPTVAVCVGHCVGAGAELAAGCDLRVGGDNLRLRWPGASHGVPVGPAKLVPLVGLARAKDLILTGRTVGCEEAAAIGLLQATAPAPQAEATALELARAIARHSPTGVRQLKAMFRELEGTERRVAYENELLVEFQRTGAGLPRRD